MVQVIIIIGMSLEPVELGIDIGEGFEFNTLTDNDGDGRIEAMLPFNSTIALAIDQAGGTLEDCIIWDVSGSEVYVDHPSFDVPIFANVAGSLGVDLGALLPPPTSFQPGQTFEVRQGELPLWPAVRFIDETGVADLRTFAAGRNTLPNFEGSVVVSEMIVRFAVPEPTTLLLGTMASIGLMLRRRCLMR